MALHLLHPLAALVFCCASASNATAHAHVMAMHVQCMDLVVRIGGGAVKPITWQESQPLHSAQELAQETKLPRHARAQLDLLAVCEVGTVHTSTVAAQVASRK